MSGRRSESESGPGLGVLHMLVAVVAFASAPSILPAQAALSGVVLDEDGTRPLPAADVELVGEGRRTHTGDDGRFEFRDVARGPHRIRIVALGYRDTDTTLVAAPGESPPFRLLLVRAPLPLEGISIAPGRIGLLEASPAISGTVLSRADIESIPQVGGDVLRMLRAMPGVSADDISSKLNVRGAAPRDTQVRLDGMELFEPYHLQDLDGALGVVDVESLGSMEMITGGFPADMGGRLGSILDMRTRPPPPQGGRTAAGLSLSSVFFSSQGTFAEDRGQWLATARRGFLDIVLDITGVDDRMSPRYWDGLGRVQLLVAPEHLVSVEVLAAGDDGLWSDEEDSGAHLESAWSSGYAWATWQASFRRGLRAATLVSLGRLTRDRTGSVSKPDDGVFTPLLGSVRDVASYDFAGVRQDWQATLSEDVVMKAGFDVRYGTADYDYASSATWLALDERGRIARREDRRDVEASPSGYEGGGYLSARARTGRDLTWEVGLRFDGLSHTGDREVSPRILARWDPGARTSLKASVGQYVQGQRLYELDVVDGEIAFSPAERGRQVALGIERRFGRGLNGRLEAYYRLVHDARAFFGNISREINPLLELDSDRMRLDPTRSRAQGIELVLTREGEAPLAWAAMYVLSRSEDEIEGVWVPRTLDQLHTLTVRAAYPRGRSWQLSAAWQYHTGWPATDQILEVVVAEDASGDAARLVQRRFGPLNRERLPAYHRLDVRATRSFGVRGGRLEFFLDVFNVYDRVNLRGFAYNLRRSGGSWTSRRVPGEELLPRMPTLGVRWVF